MFGMCIRHSEQHSTHTLISVGWFFGDFFVDEFAASLEYTGIYRYGNKQQHRFLVLIASRRYLNNPEVMSGAAFFGLALISGSKLVFTLAVIRHLSQWWFLSKVEK
jgi:phosphatidylethanolamine N-methyltransferase